MNKMINKNREHTVCFNMPDSGHYYIGLTVHAFNDFIFQRMGNLCNCYILHSRTLKAPSLMFSSTNRLPILYDSVEDQVEFVLRDRSPFQTFSQRKEPLTL